MTREREIHNAYKEHLLTEGNPSNGFEYGAEWADAHPVNPWHKVSEELPKVDKYRKSIKVLARKGDDVFVAFYSVMAGFSLSSVFYTEYALSGVTHWMPIPEIKED